MLKKIGAVILIAALLCQGISLSVAAGSAFNDVYSSYTYDVDDQSIPSPPLYVPQEVIGHDLGEYGSLATPTDLCVADEELYVLDSVNNRVVVFDAQLEPKRVVTLDYEPKIEDARGIYVHDNGDIYLALYKQKRVLIADSTGQVKAVLEQPKSELIPSDFVYSPLKVLVNKYGYICVVAEGCYYGIVLMNQNGGFEGFYASNQVEQSVLSAITTFLKSFFTNAQKSKLQRTLPTEYSSLALDKDGFIYTTSSTVTNMANALKKLSPSGKSILKNNNNKNFGDLEIAVVASSAQKTLLSDLCVDDNGYIYALDTNAGKVFQYDGESNLLGVFGGKTQQLGGFTEPVAVESFAGKILVVDQKRNQIVCLEITEYGQMLHDALRYYNEGIYDEAKELWRQIKERNGNLPLAYDGLGKAAYAEKQYKLAMDYFRISENKSDYNLAFEAYRTVFLQKYFPVFFFIVVILLVALWVYLSRQIKQGYSAKALSRKRKYITPFYTMFHPIDGFDQLKREKKGNLFYSFIVLFLVLVVRIVSLQYTGFLFNAKEADEINILFEVAQVVVLFAVWVLSNWSVSTLMDGEGFAKEIWTASAYSLLPSVFSGVLSLVLSNVLTQDEAFFVHGVTVIGTIWCTFNMVIALMKVHQYSFGKTIASAVLTVLGIAFVFFVCFLMYSIVGQFTDFIKNIVAELQFRM